jgi:hypothetical protein
MTSTHLSVRHTHFSRFDDGHLFDDGVFDGQSFAAVALDALNTYLMHVDS